MYELEQALPAERRALFLDTWRARVERSADALKDALESLLTGAFSGKDGTQPILLVIDDLEQRLKQPQPGEVATPFKSASDMAVFGAIIAAFRDARATGSRLLITSRYTFSLTDRRGKDLAVCLTTVPLPPMDDVERDKQMRAAASIAGCDRDTPSDTRSALEVRIREAASGNPGLQEILTRPLLAGDLVAAGRAVGAVERYLETGHVPPDAAAAAEFFQRVSLEEFRGVLTQAETDQLRAATLFELPVPLPVLEAAGAAAGVDNPVAALARLKGLGLLDRYQLAADKPECSCNPLARPLVPALSEAEAAQLAAAAIGPLAAAWTRKDGDLPWTTRGLEAAHLALLGGAPAPIINAAVSAGGFFVFRALHDAVSALDLVNSALAALESQKAAPDFRLLVLGIQCAERLGDAELLDRLLTQGLTNPPNDLSAHATLLSEGASRRLQTGDPALAETMLREAVDHFGSLGDVFSRAVTMGRIADIVQARGDLDEALRIRREEQLPVYERLGEVRERAVTMGRIADIVQARGDLDEALRVRREEQLPVYERLGDARARGDDGPNRRHR